MGDIVDPGQRRNEIPKRTWFERNPKKTLSLFLLLVLLGLTFITEKILEFRASTHTSGITRHIRLREYEPYFARVQIYDHPKQEFFDSFSYKKYSLRVDGDGFIEPSRIHARPDLTVVFQGGSTTECTWVDAENKFPYVVGRLLEKGLGVKVNSYNASRPGNTTLHSIDVLLNKIIPLNPNIVVMMHNVNDLTTLLYEKTYWNNNPYRSVIVTEKPSIGGKLKEIRDMVIPHLYAGLKEVIRWGRGPRADIDEFQQVRGEKVIIDQPYLLREFRRNLETFISICRIRQITPVLMTQENRLTDRPDPIILRRMRVLADSHGVSYHDYKEIYDLFNQAIRETGAKSGVLVVDLAQKVPPDKEYLYDAVHLTDRGSQLAARIIHEALQPLAASLVGPKKRELTGSGGR
jgi:lysophospholipase L1-like esterase